MGTTAIIVRREHPNVHPRPIPNRNNIRRTVEVTEHPQTQKLTDNRKFQRIILSSLVAITIISLTAFLLIRLKPTISEIRISLEIFESISQLIINSITIFGTLHSLLLLR